MTLANIFARFVSQFDRYDAVISTGVAAYYYISFGNKERPVTGIMTGVAFGCFWPVTLPSLITYDLWQENKGRILAKHSHKKKKELWVDDFLVDMED